MIKGKVFFHPIEGSASLTISWSSHPKGDAIEAQNGNGVGFFSESGHLLAVIFDEVLEESDHQILDFKHHQVEVRVKEGKVFYNLMSKEPSRKPKKSRSSRIKTRSRKSSVK